MKTHYYLFGGQPRQYTSGWKGYPQPGLSRVAAETRGLSSDEVEYLPYRASGPEPLDPGEGGLAGIPIWDGLSDNEKHVVMIAGVVGVFLLGRRHLKKFARGVLGR